MTLDKSIWPGWEIGKVLGRGGFSTVYEIRRNNFGVVETAALKVITIPQDHSEIEELRLEGYDDPTITAQYRSYLETIVGEYNLMTRLKGHSNVVYCDDLRYVQHEDGIGWDIYIRMELLQPLARALDAEVEERQVVRLGRDICQALILCRENDILHRDIKPQNIFVGRDGTFKLGDFGIAKVTEKTSSGTKVGTYKYMAPEVYKGQPYGHQADIYSLGMVMYWMLNQRRLPFLPLPPLAIGVGADEQARLRRFNGEPLPLPAEGCGALQAIVMKACAYDPADRYASADEMLAELDALELPEEDRDTVTAFRHTEEETGEEVLEDDAGDDKTDGIFRDWDERDRLRRLQEEEERRRREEEQRRQEEEQRRLREQEERRRQEEEQRRREREALETALKDKSQIEDLKLIGLTVLAALLLVVSIMTISLLGIAAAIYCGVKAWEKARQDRYKKKLVFITLAVCLGLVLALALNAFVSSGFRLRF